MVAAQGVGVAVDVDGAVGIVDMAEHIAVFHFPFGMLAIDAGFFLKLYDRDGLVHECREAARLLVHLGSTT